MTPAFGFSCFEMLRKRIGNCLCKALAHLAGTQTKTCATRRNKQEESKDEERPDRKRVLHMQQKWCSKNARLPSPRHCSGQTEKTNRSCAEIIPLKKCLSATCLEHFNALQPPASSIPEQPPGAFRTVARLHQLIRSFRSSQPGARCTMRSRVCCIGTSPCRVWRGARRA